MAIELKTPREIEMMRRAGAVAHRILTDMAAAVAPGVTTADLLKICVAGLDRTGAVGTSKYYPTYKPGEGFPAEMCISVNEEVVHGIPGPRKLVEGDILKLDLALTLDGYCADTCVTVPVGRLSPRAEKLVRVTRETLQLALDLIRPGRRWSDIARQMQWNVEKNKFSVVREFVGHGVGRSMHEDPKVPNFVTGEQLRGDFVLAAGMTFAVEPMVVGGKRDVELLPDNWTVVTADRQPAAHFEHTVAVTAEGVDVLTDGHKAPAVGQGGVARELRDQ
jgi:methionyl aminopeptidase